MNQEMWQGRIKGLCNRSLMLLGRKTYGVQNGPKWEMGIGGKMIHNSCIIHVGYNYHYHHYYYYININQLIIYHTEFIHKLQTGNYATHDSRGLCHLMPEWQEVEE